MHKVVIEARINEKASRISNPNVPWSAAEIAADTSRLADGARKRSLGLDDLRGGTFTGFCGGVILAP